MLTSVVEYIIKIMKQDTSEISFTDVSLDIMKPINTSNKFEKHINNIKYAIISLHTINLYSSTSVS
jgi:hypothetical protein